MSYSGSSKAASGSIARISSEDSLPPGFPATVASLFVTGVLDGCPVFYWDVKERKHRYAIILKDRYLCGCGDCRFSRPVTGAEFLHHFGATYSCSPEKVIAFKTVMAVESVIWRRKISSPGSLFSTLASLSGIVVNKQNFWDYWNGRSNVQEFWDNWNNKMYPYGARKPWKERCRL